MFKLVVEKITLTDTRGNYCETRTHRGVCLFSSVICREFDLTFYGNGAHLALCSVSTFPGHRHLKPYLSALLQSPIGLDAQRYRAPNLHLDRPVPHR